jgi:hypothetical protein
MQPKGWQGKPRERRACSREAGHGRAVRGKTDQNPRLDVGRRAGARQRARGGVCTRVCGCACVCARERGAAGGRGCFGIMNDKEGYGGSRLTTTGAQVG